MTSGGLNWIATYIRGIADDVLRDLYQRGKYRDVILPMTVLRRLDAVLENGKADVLAMKETLDEAGIVEQEATLRQTAGQAFYNNPKFTLRDLRSRASRERLEADFLDYLDGDSRNVQDILPEYSLVTRSSDGRMLFLANKLSKMKRNTRLGSRLAEVHNGSSLFTGDAGQGESNIRRWIIENDWLEAIIALPLNLFYNTGIATYVWVLTDRKPAHRRGKVQLIDATGWHRPLRKNLGKKNCELGEDDIERICRAFLDFEETEQSRIFENDAFGDWKVTVERPLRVEGVDPERACKASEIKELREHGTRSESAPPVIRRIHKRGTDADPLRGLFGTTVGGRSAVVEYEPDTDLRDTEQIALREEGGIEAFLRREVLPYAEDMWYRPDRVKIGYEISFNRYFYKAEPVRTLAEIRADILALEEVTEGLLGEIVGYSP